eukprot:scaffold18065_cov59-Phaeocystis_antarctica.AAC.8
MLRSSAAGGADSCHIYVWAREFMRLAASAMARWCHHRHAANSEARSLMAHAKRRAKSAALPASAASTCACARAAPAACAAAAHVRHATRIDFSSRGAPSSRRAPCSTSCAWRRSAATAAQARHARARSRCTHWLALRTTAMRAATCSCQWDKAVAREIWPRAARWSAARRTALLLHCATDAALHRASTRRSPSSTSFLCSASAAHDVHARAVPVARIRAPAARKSRSRSAASRPCSCQVLNASRCPRRTSAPTARRSNARLAPLSTPWRFHRANIPASAAATNRAPALRTSLIAPRRCSAKASHECTARAAADDSMRFTTRVQKAKKSWCSSRLAVHVRHARPFDPLCIARVACTSCCWFANLAATCSTHVRQPRRSSGYRSIVSASLATRLPGPFGREKQPVSASDGLLNAGSRPSKLL